MSVVKGVFGISNLIPRDKRIAVLVSGGWDSAVLWTVAKATCNTRGQECIPFTVPKLDGAVYYANKVLEATCEFLKTPTMETTVVGSIDSENPSDYVTSGAHEILERDLADYILNAKNAYPPNQRDMLPDGYPLPNDRFEPSEEEKQYVGHPFAEWTKDRIIKLGFDLGIGEIIMPITHSCTELDRGRCGNCWWCKEREWAFNRLELIDGGTQ